MRVEIIMLLMSIGYVRLDKTDENKTFTPTKEWKVIKEGQSIPAGLHVRINLQTGKKEAKLLDSDEKVSQKTSVVAVSEALSVDITQDDPETKPLRHKDALKNIPDEGFEYSEEKLKNITKKFRSYENIKQEFADVNMQIKTDYQLLSDLFLKYDAIKNSNHIDPDQFRPLFEDLEYLLHQIDNANDFVFALNGLEKIILPNLGNQSTPELKMHSIKLLGTLMQNNPKGQIAAFEKNMGSLLLQLLSKSNNNNTNELSSTIFALGGLLRNFPLAQHELLNKPGLKILIDLLGKHDYKITIKCLLLLADLIQDCNQVNGPELIAGDIRKRLSETEYCTIMDDLFNRYRPDYLESLYATEDILNILIASKHICQSVWEQSPIFRHSLLVIRSHYDQMKGERDEVDNVLNNQLEDLLEFLFSHTVIKGEL